MQWKINDSIKNRRKDNYGCLPQSVVAIHSRFPANRCFIPIRARRGRQIRFEEESGGNISTLRDWSVVKPNSLLR